jgi:hypothetical protein
MARIKQPFSASEVTDDHWGSATPVHDTYDRSGSARIIPESGGCLCLCPYPAFALALARVLALLDFLALLVLLALLALLIQEDAAETST